MPETRLFASRGSVLAAIVEPEGKNVVKADPFMPKPRTIVPFSLREFQEVYPKNAQSGAQSLPIRNLVFELDTQGNYADRWITLVFTVSAFTLGAGGTFARFTDWGPFKLFFNAKKASRERYLTTELYRMEQDLQHFMGSRYEARDVWEEVAKDAGGFLSAAERNAKAQSATTYRVRMPVHWLYRPEFAPTLTALGAPYILELDTYDYADVVETDATTPPAQSFTVTDIHLEMEFKHVQLPIGEKYNAIAQSGKSRFTTLLDKDSDHVIAAGKSSETITLTHLQHLAECLIFELQPETDFTDYQRKYYNFDPSYWDDVRIELLDGNRRIITVRPAFPTSRSAKLKLASAVSLGDNRVVVYFKHSPMTNACVDGYLPFDTLKNPKLVLTKTSGTFPVNLRLNVWAVCVGLIQEKGGNVKVGISG